MEDQKLSDGKVLWETEFYALSMISGDIERFRGIFIGAKSLSDALKMIRTSPNMNFLQLTGDWFKDVESVIKNERFYKQIDDENVKIEGMSFDTFCDWLDNALTIGDLLEAKEIVEESVSDPTEYLKIIETYIKRKQDEEKNKGNNKEGRV